VKEAASNIQGLKDKCRGVIGYPDQIYNKIIEVLVFSKWFLIEFLSTKCVCKILVYWFIIIVFSDLFI